MEDSLKLHYGYLFEDDLLQEINDAGIYKEIPEGQKLIEIGDTIKSMPLLLSGAIKILREDEDSNELVIYYLEQGDTCAMTINCCLGLAKSEIRAIAENDTKLVMIPVAKMSEWMSKYKSWQNFILQSYNDRLKEMLEAIDTIAFFKMDERLLKHLKDKALVNHNDVMQVTHKEIANDLHTSRVVVSRLLKSLEKEGKIEMNRNQIKIINL